ncbi:MAG: type II toxin-antitoxin system death-on-curing family toxin [Acidobacteriota bacterium]|jgi:death-on-curing protein|nr:type II toxin-antitoxin system death-on-curing family toxin [Acidobacteriota bacterium]
MSEIFFPDLDEILLVHAEIIKHTGGSEGLRDEGGLDSALKVAENRYNYETQDLAKLAATYAYHLSQAHAFVDGNKRIAAVISELFLKLNNAKLTVTNDEIIELFLDIAASKLSREDVEEKFADWLVITE